MRLSYRVVKHIHTELKVPSYHHTVQFLMRVVYGSVKIYQLMNVRISDFFFLLRRSFEPNISQWNKNKELK